MAIRDDLPNDAAARKAIPLATGLLDYFPSALVAVAALSAKGNDQHNPGQRLHWDRAKSGDEADALLRHLMQRGTTDTDGVLHSAKVAWRGLALLQKELEACGAPIARGAMDVPKDDGVWPFAPEVALVDGFPVTGGGESSQLTPAQEILIDRGDEEAPTAGLKANEAYDQHPGGSA